MAATPEFRHATSGMPESLTKMVTMPEVPTKITTTSESSAIKATSRLPEPRLVSSLLPEPRLVFQSHVSSHHVFQSHVTSRPHTVHQLESSSTANASKRTVTTSRRLKLRRGKLQTTTLAWLLLFLALDSGSKNRNGEDVTTKTAQARAQVQNKDSIPNVPTFIASMRQGYISPESFRRDADSSSLGKSAKREQSKQQTNTQQCPQALCMRAPLQTENAQKNMSIQCQTLGHG
ncbi:hypothetical protein DPX16_15014 [Anabarilius grahami]|uniref:Uncharacterized protein n=1 Tax=Anabarilius grahami TaxID=495550 RepID=A0A3N0YXB5_ANAGA|nr:hypothetical protein DPX16_15014 [Anabarilius grahami]